MRTWYYVRDGKRVGPVTEGQLASLAGNGQLQPSDYVFTEGMSSWQPASTVSGLPFGRGTSVTSSPDHSRAAASGVNHQILGDDLQVLEIMLDPGMTVIAEAGAMNYMEDGIAYEARLGDGSQPDQGFWSRVFSAGKRWVTGESICLTHFTNRSNSRKSVTFAAPYPGKIVAVRLADTGGSLICQKDAFLAAELGTRIDIAFVKRLGTGFFGGEGFILQRLSGSGHAFIHAGGMVVAKELRGEKLLVDTGCLVAFTTGINYSIQPAGGLKTMVFGGEGLFLATLQGHGRVWLQSLPFARLANRIVSQALPSTRKQDEGSVLGGLGSIFKD